MGVKIEGNSSAEGSVSGHGLVNSGSDKGKSRGRGTPCSIPGEQPEDGPESAKDKDDHPPSADVGVAATGYFKPVSVALVHAIVWSTQIADLSFLLFSYRRDL